MDKWPADIVQNMTGSFPTLSQRDIEEEIRKYPNAGDVEGLRRVLKEKTNVTEYECNACFDTCPVSQIFTMKCSERHKFCFDCLSQYIQMKLSEGAPIKCPMSECTYVMSEQDVKDLSELCSEHVVRKDQVKKYSQQILDRAVKDIPGIVGCPTPGCTYWVLPYNIAKCELCHCPSCGNNFCTLCKKPFHFHCRCGEVPLYTERWLSWCSSGRSAYNKDKKEAMDKVRAQEARNKELLAKYTALREDEKYKEEHGRVCPNCGRIIIKDGGCDLMVCGRNYRGGNVQDGCGFNFNWSQAKRYVSNVNTEPKEKLEPVEIPEIAREAVHEGFACAKCMNEIKLKNNNNNNKQTNNNNIFYIFLLLCVCFLIEDLGLFAFIVLTLTFVRDARLRKL